MPRVLAVAVVLLLAAAAVWLALADGDAQGLSPAIPASPGNRTSTPAPASPERSEQPAPQQSSVPAEPDASPQPTQSPSPLPAQPAEESPITVQLRVRDVVTLQPLPTFAWRWRSGQHGQAGEGSDGAAALAVPAGRGELLVEAQGYEPFQRIDLAAPAPPAEPLQLDVFLVPTSRGAGVRLRVVDELGAVVPHLQVGCFPLGAEVDWRPGMAPLVPRAAVRPLWRRRTSAADGVYELPGLAPGRYSIEAVAVDAEGATLPKTPAWCSFESTGSNAIEEVLVLRPGTVLTLELVDAQGRFLDPQACSGIGVLLRQPAGGGGAQEGTPSGRQPPGIRELPGAEAHPGIDWLAAAEATAEAKVAAVDAMAAAAPITARLPLAPGSYQLKVLCGGELRLTTTLQLRPGEAQTERVVVP